MKAIKSSLIGLATIGGLIVLKGFIQAQVATMPVQSISGTAVLPDNQPDSVVRVVADSQGLQLVPPDQIPRFGTFWIVSGTQPPPPYPFLPPEYDPATTPVFSLGPDGQFLVDATGGAAPQPNRRQAMLGESTATLVQAQVNSLLGLIGQVQEAQMNTELGLPFPGDGSDSGGTNTYFESNFTPVNYGTNLWIANFGLSSGNGVGIVSNTTADVYYEIQYVHDLTSTQWLSAGFVLGSELTNWTAMVMTNALSYTNNLFLRIRSWADDGSGLPIWWQMQYFGTTGVDPNALDPTGDGWTIWQDFEAGYSPLIFRTPPAPEGLTMQVDSTGTNVTLSWQSSSGNVSYYEVDEVYPSFALGTVPTGSPTTFSTTLDYVYFGTETLGPGFQVIAHYTNGATSASAVVWMTPSYAPTLQAQVLRNSQGQLELVTGHLRPDATTIRLFWDTNYYQYAHYDVPASNVVDGLYALPDSLAGVFAANAVDIEILYKSGQFDYVNDFSSGTGDPDFVDAPDWPTWINTSARYLKDNLHFLLRSATVNHSFSYGSTVGLSRPETGSAYEYSGYLDPAVQADDPFRPMEENYLWRNFAYVDGDLNTGASYGNGERIAGNAPDANQPEYVVQGSNLPPYTVSSPLLTDSTTSNFFYPPVYSEAGLNVNGNGYVTLPTGVNNVYGLPILSVKNDSGDEIDAGAAPIFTSDQFGGNWYAESAMPSLATVGFYFVSEVPYDYYGSTIAPAPSLAGFSPTNTTPLLIAGMNVWPYGVMGWAKQTIQNNYSGKFAYLEQFFDQAYQINTNGVVTTNSAGVLSAYGEFFPTVPGPAALVTMPDIDTGQRGTCTVYCVSLVLDANHDGNMDLSWSGPDAMSQACPDRIWINND